MEPLGGQLLVRQRVSAIRDLVSRCSLARVLNLGDAYSERDADILRFVDSSEVGRSLWQHCLVGAMCTRVRQRIEERGCPF